MTVAEQTLYGRLGEEVGIKAVVEDFYQRLLADPTLAPTFEGVALSTLKAHQAALISEATGGPKGYTGREMAQAHAGRDITGEQFDAVVGHLVASLQSFHVAEDDIAAIGATLMPFRSEIVTA